MRLRRRTKDRAHGRFDMPLIEIGYASTISGPTPIAELVEGATREDAEFVKAWLDAVRSGGHSVEHFVVTSEVMR